MGEKGEGNGGDGGGKWGEWGRELGMRYPLSTPSFIVISIGLNLTSMSCKLSYTTVSGRALVGSRP